MRTLVLSTTLVLSLALLGCERENPAPPDTSRPDAQLGDAGPADSGTDAGDLDGGGLADGGDGGTPTDAGTCAGDRRRHLLRVRAGDERRGTSTRARPRRVSRSPSRRRACRV